MVSSSSSSPSEERFALLIIDPQVDFHEGGSLAVAGAQADALRTRDFILRHLDHITNIYITLDSHQRNHIGHGIFWTNAKGEHPPPFTVLTYEDIQEGVWFPVQAKYREHALWYTKRLEENGRFQATIWPEHCLVLAGPDGHMLQIGSSGQCVVPPVLEAVHAWLEKTGRPIRYHWKGMNVLTEMYSVFKADVPMPDDPATAMDMKLVEELKAEPKVYICGQALSHCINFSTTDLLSVWPADRVSDLVVLSDMTSPVGGFEAQGQEFLDRMRSRGVIIR